MPPSNINLTDIRTIGKEALSNAQLLQEKSVTKAYILAIALGFFGAHNFYLKRTWFGLSFLSSFGELGIGYVVDILRIPDLVKQANDRLENPDLPIEKNLIDAYMLWFPYGVLGLHLYYLGKRSQALLYLCTGGLFGIGFLVDLFRMPALVKAANQQSVNKWYVTLLHGLVYSYIRRIFGHNHNTALMTGTDPHGQTSYETHNSASSVGQ